MPQKLYQHRIRAGSTMTKWSVSEIPSYLKPLLAHFSYEKAREYFRIYSLFITVREIYNFSKSRLSQDLQANFESLTLPHLVEFICDIYRFKQDPYCLKPQIAKLLKSIGTDSALLSKNTKRLFIFYTSPKFLHFARIAVCAYGFYEWIKNLECKFRHWWRRNKISF